jgi:hypothetical protein
MIFLTFLVLIGALSPTCECVKFHQHAISNILDAFQFFLHSCSSIVGKVSLLNPEEKTILYPYIRQDCREAILNPKNASFPEQIKEKVTKQAEQNCKDLRTCISIMLMSLLEAITNGQQGEKAVRIVVEPTKSLWDDDKTFVNSCPIFPNYLFDPSPHFILIPYDIPGDGTLFGVQRDLCFQKQENYRFAGSILIDYKGQNVYGVVMDENEPKSFWHQGKLLLESRNYLFASSIDNLDGYSGNYQIWLFFVSNQGPDAIWTSPDNPETEPVEEIESDLPVSDPESISDPKLGRLESTKTPRINASVMSKCLGLCLFGLIGLGSCSLGLYYFVAYDFQVPPVGFDPYPETSDYYCSFLSTMSEEQYVADDKQGSVIQNVTDLDISSSQDTNVS